MTGTIARTAANVRAGAHGPIAGILPSAFVHLFMMVFAPLASAIPLAALAGVLAVVVGKMIEKEEFWMPLRASSGDPVVHLLTSFLVIFRDLTECILLVFALGAVLFIRRMSEVAQVEARAPLVPEDRADEVAECDSAAAIGGDVVVYRIRGAFFFGAASTVGVVPDRIADHPRAFVLDFGEAPFLDSSAAHSVDLPAHKLARRGRRLRRRYPPHPACRRPARAARASCPSYRRCHRRGHRDLEGASAAAVA